jgi:D-glycero-D-manno-heptose 1,7-bisphosphate phosphatase
MSAPTRLSRASGRVVPDAGQEEGAALAPAVFLDKDGTLVEDIPYNVDPALIRLTPGAGDALRRLQAAGYKLILVSNQSGVARGLFTEDALQSVRDRLAVLLVEFDVSLNGFYYCPHHPDGVVPEYARTCLCRKPAPGLILDAAVKHGIDLQRSWLIGDILNDVEAGRRAACRTILLDNGNETEWELSRARLPDCVVGNLTAAADRILCSERAANDGNDDKTRELAQQPFREIRLIRGGPENQRK